MILNFKLQRRKTEDRRPKKSKEKPSSLFCLLSSVFLLLNNALAQENILTVGFQLKPILPYRFFDVNTVSITQNKINFEIAPKLGFTGGMVVRRGITRKISVETGINYIKTNHQLSVVDSSFKDISSFAVINYEIPLLCLIYIQLGEKFFMNTALGSSLDIYPSDVTTSDDYFRHYSQRKSMFQAAFLANLGYEYRTESSGYFYFGVSYHRPYTYIYNSAIEYKKNTKDEMVQTKLYGNYLTIDFRYFFNETPLDKQLKVKTEEQ